MSESNINPKGYSTNDFHWVSVKDYYSKLNCKSVELNDHCSTIGTTSDILDHTQAKACYDAALCNNKKLSDSLDTAKLSHSGTDMRYIDTKNSYIIELRKTINLGIGITAMSIFIYLNWK
jgi:hypothetical protein